jgi:hypothetical protein
MLTGLIDFFLCWIYRRREVLVAIIPMKLLLPLCHKIFKLLLGLSVYAASKPLYKLLPTLLVFEVPLTVG